MKLYVFNPENDLALANNQWNFIAPASARKMRQDLETLPVWWTSKEDCVWVSKIPDHLPFEQLGLMSRFVLHPHVRAHHELEPWGWSPLMRAQFLRGGIDTSCLPSENQLSLWRQFSGRGFAVHVLQMLQERISVSADKSACFCGQSFFCTSAEQVNELFLRFPHTILKAPWSGSGKGLRLGMPVLQPPLTGWCNRLIREQGGVVLEPLYNKVCDFACEFHSDGNGCVTYEGLSLFTTTHQGIYSGNLVSSEAEKEAVLGQWISLSVLEWLREQLTQIFSSTLGKEYSGAFGVDMMVCRAEDNRMLLHPCVEINLRMTMGMVAQFMKKWVADDICARFYIDFCAKPGELHQKSRVNATIRPPHFHEGKLIKGLLPLTPVTPETTYLACLEIE